MKNQSNGVVKKFLTSKVSTEAGIIIAVAFFLTASFLIQFSLSTSTDWATDDIQITLHIHKPTVLANKQTNPPPIIFVSSPTANSMVSGNVHIVGAAVDGALAPDTAISTVQIFIDNQFSGNATYGGVRPIVCASNNYPNRPGCPNVGIDYTFDSTKLVNGIHLITITATDTDPASNGGPQSSSFFLRLNFQNTPSQAPVISSFTTSPGAINTGQSSTLSWSVSGTPTPTLSITPGIGNVTGSSISVSPLTTTTYTLTATNSAGSSQATTTITVALGPAPALRLSPANLYFSAVKGGSPPPSQAIILNNTVVGSIMKWQAIVAGSPYCSIDHNQGTLNDQSEITVTVSMTVPSIAGTFPCTITFMDNGSIPPMTNLPQIVNLSYGVLVPGSVPKIDTTAPATPGSLTAVAAGLSSVNLSWIAMGGDPDSQTAGYLVFRDNALLATTGLTTYTDSSLAAQSYHIYVVEAFDSSLNYSGPTAAVPVTTFGPINTSIPGAYQGLYQSLQATMNTEQTQVSNVWTGNKYPVNYSTNLTNGDDNSGTSLFLGYCPVPTKTSNCLVDQELNSIQALGMNAVKVTIGYPIFDPNYYTYNGLPASYAQSFLNYYIALAQDIRSRGLKLIVQAAPIFPGFGNSDPSGYYNTLSWQQYENLRSQHNLMVAQQIKPDYLVLQSEPSSDSTNNANPTISANLNDPVADAAMIQQFVNDLNAASIPGLHSTIKIGSGMGAWQTAWQQLLTGLTAISGLDSIDMHVYWIADPKDGDEITVAMQIAAAAHAAGKGATMSEFWPKKTSSSNAGVFTSPMTDYNNDLNARANFSFWLPLDQQQFATMIQLANYEKLDYFSPYNDTLFWSYLDYNNSAAQNTPCPQVYPAANASQNAICDTNIQNAQNALANQALSTNGPYSQLGTAYKNDISTYWLPH